MGGDDYLRRNRSYWNQQAPLYAAHAGDAWRQEEPTWGIWGIPERDVHLLDADLPVKSALVRDQFGLHRLDWPDDGNTEFHLSHGERIRHFRDSGLEVVDLLELRAPEGATTRYDFVKLEWARRWPSEEVWRVRKRR